MPHIFVAVAAASVFIVLGILILGAILTEKWYAHHGRRILRQTIAWISKTFAHSKSMAVGMANSIQGSSATASRKLTPSNGLEIISRGNT